MKQISIQEFQQETKTAFGKPIGEFPFDSSFTSPVYPMAEAKFWNGFFHDVVKIQRCVAGFAVFYNGRAGISRIDYVGKRDPTNNQTKAFFECLEGYYVS